METGRKKICSKMESKWKREMEENRRATGLRMETKGKVNENVMETGPGSRVKMSEKKMENEWKMDDDGKWVKEETDGDENCCKEDMNENGRKET